MASINPNEEIEETAGGSKSQPTLLSRRRTSTGLDSSLRTPSRIITVVGGEGNNNNEISDELSSGSIWKSNNNNSSKSMTTNNNPSSPAHCNDGTEKSCTEKSSGTSTILLPPDDIMLLTQRTTAMIQQQRQTREPQTTTEKREEKEDEKAAYRRRKQQQHEPSISLLHAPPPPQTDSSSAGKTRNSAANKDEKKISILSTDEILLLSQTTTMMMAEQERESQTKTTTTIEGEEEDGDLQRNPVENAKVRASREKARAIANHPSSSNTTTTTTTTETCDSAASAPGVVRVRGIGYTGQGSSLDKFTSDSFSVEDKENRSGGLAIHPASTSTQGASIGVEEATHPQIQPGATLIRGPGEAKKIPSLVVAAEVVSPKDDDDDIEKKLDERLKQERSTLRMEMMKDAPRAEVIDKFRRRNCSLRAKGFLGVFILLLIVGIVVGLVFGISRNENDNQNEIEEPSAPIVADVEEEGEDCIAMVPETICYERIPGQGRSDVCTKEETMMKGGGGVPNLVAQSRLDQVFTADISILNGGEVAGDIMQGHFTTDMLDTLFRFENSLLTILLSGEQVIQVLEEGVEWTFVDNSTGCYPYAAGLRYAVDFGADFPHRLSQVEVKPKNGNVWMPINATQNYTVVTNSYLLSGGDGYYEFTRADQSTVRQVLTTPEGAFTNFGLRVKEFLDPPSSDYSTQSFIPSPKCRVCHEFHTFDTEP